MTSNELKSKDCALQKVSRDNSGLRNRVAKLSKEVRRLRAKILRAPGQRSRAVEAAVAEVERKLKVRPDVWRIKRPDGRIENWVRDLTCKLICIRHVPASQAPSVISDVLEVLKARAGAHDGTSKNLGADCVETFSDRSARRFPLEGHTLTKMKIAKEFGAAPGQCQMSCSCAITHRSKGWTASGDGTTYKGVNAVSHFMTFPPESSVDSTKEAGPTPHRRFLGTTREVNHKTSTQLENWLGLLTDIASVHNESPGGSKEPISATEIGRKATGYSADHAADQMKLSKELHNHKLERSESVV